MQTPFTYSTTFTLDKQYLAECYEETSIVQRSIKAFLRSITLIVIAIILFTFSELDFYINTLILILGVIDAASICFHKAWWLARQAFGSTYNKEVTLTINEDGITTKGKQVNSTILWPDISQTEQTSKGLLIHHAKGKSYLSNGCLAEEVISYIIGYTRK